MGQDWGGRRKVNPDNIKRVTRKSVLDFAKKLDIEVMREGQGMWLYKKNDIWYTLGQTNYIAIQTLTKLEKEQTL
jgi:hypothetical protein